MANRIGETRAIATEKSTAAAVPGGRAVLKDDVDVFGRVSAAGGVDFAGFAGTVLDGGRRQCRCWWEGGGLPARDGRHEVGAVAVETMVGCNLGLAETYQFLRGAVRRGTLIFLSKGR